uniref:Uncharacterized protein n=1 Tax=Siphoviridae sp. ct96x5 TaxID=2825367 RepID=A0A8S5PSL0_9CAUD|nr:MAG TPA: hypothetical protein [Siphoviridae sp. ct96x5]
MQRHPVLPNVSFFSGEEAGASTEGKDVVACFPNPDWIRSSIKLFM